MAQPITCPKCGRMLAGYNLVTLRGLCPFCEDCVYPEWEKEAEKNGALPKDSAPVPEDAPEETEPEPVPEEDPADAEDETVAEEDVSEVSEPEADTEESPDETEDPVNEAPIDKRLEKLLRPEARPEHEKKAPLFHRLFQKPEDNGDKKADKDFKIDLSKLQTPAVFSKAGGFVVGLSDPKERFFTKESLFEAAKELLEKPAAATALSQDAEERSAYNVNHDHYYDDVLPLYEARIDRIPLSFIIRVIIAVCTIIFTALAIAYRIV